MKTGKVANRFNVDPNTISDWTDRFADFFSPSARKEGRSQRAYDHKDLIVINTIRSLRVKNTEWELILKELEAGNFDMELPPEFTTIEGENAVVVYAEVAAMRVELQSARADAERLQKELQKERDEKQAIQDKYEKLLREIGKLEGQIEMMQRNQNGQ